MGLIFVLYALFASMFTISKVVLGFSQPFFVVGTRMLIAGGLMLLYKWITSKEECKILTRDLWQVAVLGLIAIYLTNVCEFWGLQYLTSFKTCFIYSLSPFVSAILCYFMFKEALTWKKCLGLVIGFIGFIPILMSQGGSEETSGQIAFFSGAEVAVIVAAVSSVYGWILLGQLIKKGYSPITINGWSMMLGGILALIHSAFSESWDPIPVMPDKYWAFAEGTLMLMIISNFVAYNLYGYLLKRFSAPYLSFAGLTTPMFTVLFGWVILGEVATLSFYISAAIVFTGLYLFHQEELRLGARIPEIVEEG